MKNKKHTRKTNIFVLLFSSFISIIMCFTFLSPFYGNIASTFNNCAGFGTSLQAIKVTGQKSGLFETQRFSSTSTNIMPEQKSYSSSYGDQPQPFTHWKKNTLTVLSLFFTLSFNFCDDMYFGNIPDNIPFNVLEKYKVISDLQINATITLSLTNHLEDEVSEDFTLTQDSDALKSYSQYRDLGNRGDKKIDHLGFKIRDDNSTTRNTEESIKNGIVFVKDVNTYKYQISFLYPVFFGCWWEWPDGSKRHYGMSDQLDNTHWNNDHISVSASIMNDIANNSLYFTNPECITNPNTIIDPRLLNINFLLTVDQKNSLIDEKDGRFQSHFAVKLNTDYIEATLMEYDVVKNQSNESAWSDTDSIYKTDYDNFIAKFGSASFAPIIDGIVDGKLLAWDFFEYKDSGVLLPNVDKPICKFSYSPDEPPSWSASDFVENCNSSADVSSIFDVEERINSLPELLWHKHFNTINAADPAKKNIAWTDADIKLYPHFEKIIQACLTDYASNSFAFNYAKQGSTESYSTSITLFDICKQCNANAAKDSQNFISFPAENKNSIIQYQITKNTLASWWFGMFVGNNENSDQHMGMCYEKYEQDGSVNFVSKILDGNTTNALIFSCSYTAFSSMLATATDTLGLFNAYNVPNWDTYFTALKSKSSDDIIAGLRQGSMLGYPFDINLFFKPMDLYAETQEGLTLSDLIYTNSFCFYKSESNQLCARVYTKDDQTLCKLTLNIFKSPAGLWYNPEYEGINKVPSYYTGGAQETNVENVLNDLIVYPTTPKTSASLMPFKTAVAKESFKFINDQFFSSWIITADDHNGALTVSGKMRDTTSTDDPGQNFCLVASGFLKTSSDLFDFNFQYKNSDGSFVPFDGEPYFTKEGDVVRAIAKASSSAAQLKINVNGKLPDNVRATKYNQVDDTIMVDYELLTDVNSTYINSFFTVYATDNEYNASKMHNIYERHEISPTTTTVNIQNEKTITETIQFNDKNKKSSSDYSAIQTFNGSPDNTKIRWTAILVSVNGSPSSDDQKKLFTNVETTLPGVSLYQFFWTNLPNPAHEDIYEFEIQATSDSNATVFDTATYILNVTGYAGGPLSTGAIVGIVFGAIVAVGIIVFICVWVKKHRINNLSKNNSKMKDDED